MCGRLNITDDPFSRLVSEIAGVQFSAVPNNDLRPTENISVIGGLNHALVQQELSWGIKPDWAKRIIINAQAETVAVKPTFKAAFHNSRVIVPCSGWYEWKGEKGNKQKYLFANPDERPLFMAGIALGDKLVTLTTSPNPQYEEYHHRMPLLLPDDVLELWVFGDATKISSLLITSTHQSLDVQRCLSL
ncbi:SOS response-associated peptidase [Vibrio sp. JC009]|uniref:SOS response-associated peptidase n=1 Tax=Vibrio sp. JC009 TaxID=2912314 RepID=UPI0023AFE84F|nr:SOS response-associated peptidase [Vibrio sp. JC009]WED23527.1 SOS response-associated peptidase [Vibrio sp. JC009]